MPGAKKQQQQQQDYSQLKLTELRELCHNRGIKVSGRKSELIDRLINLDSNGHDSNNSSNTIAGHSKKKAAAAAATDSFGFSVAYRGALVDSGAGGSGSGGFDSSSTATMENNDHLSRTESQFQLRQLAKERERAERDRLVLWRRPFATVYYALLECNFLLTNLIIRLWHNRLRVGLVALLLMALAGLRHVEGPHRRYLDIVEDTGLWCSWWIWLGILSSVGLGTGLHTFLIYLGPHIARVTLAAYECRTLDFPQPPYPAEIGCPSETVPDTVLAPSIWAILSKASTGRDSHCVVVNDDHLFPDAVTPSKVDVKLCETYDVPYMDDDCFILDECWYITDDSRLTCLRSGEHMKKPCMNGRAQYKVLNSKCNAVIKLENFDSEFFKMEDFQGYAYARYRLGISALSCHDELLKVYGDAAPGQSTVYRWYSKFRDEAFPPVSAPRTGRPRSTRTAELIETCRALVEEDPKVSVRDLADFLEVGKTTVHEILTEDLHLRNVSAVWVPHALSEENKTARINCAKQIRRLFYNEGMENFCDKYVVEDETWVYLNNTGTKQNNRCWLGQGDHRPQVVRHSVGNAKTMLLVAFTPNKRFSIESTAPKQTVDANGIVEFIRHTGDLWRTLRSRPIHLSDVLWQWDNARPHVARSVQQYMESRGVQLVFQSPYSPDFNSVRPFFVQQPSRRSYQPPRTTPRRLDDPNDRLRRTTASTTPNDRLDDPNDAPRRPQRPPRRPQRPPNDRLDDPQRPPRRPNDASTTPT
uniref:SAP domain-containing protein n=1 Tax=Macrostomum lignano TaxID=282301 RepID=A0A1I8IJZ2_9PLAT